MPFGTVLRAETTHSNGTPTPIFHSIYYARVDTMVCIVQLCCVGTSYVLNIIVSYNMYV